MTDDNDSTLKPFHESIVDALNDADSAADVSILGQKMIMKTKIPKNHDAIVEAWEKACMRVGINDDHSLVANSVREQQRDEEAKAAAKADTST